MCNSPQVTVALPWATTHHHQTRCFVHMVVKTLLEHFPLESATWQAMPGAATLLEQMQAFTAANPAAQRLVAACGLVLQPNMENVGNLDEVVSGRVGLAGSEGTAQAPMEVEAAPVPLMDRISACLQEGRRVHRAAGGNAVQTGMQRGALRVRAHCGGMHRRAVSSICKDTWARHMCRQALCNPEVKLKCCMRRV